MWTPPAPGYPRPCEAQTSRARRCRAAGRAVARQLRVEQPRRGDPQTGDGAAGIGGRDGRGFVPTADTVVEAGDQVLLVLDSGLEDQITPVFAPN